MASRSSTRPAARDRDPGHAPRRARRRRDRGSGSSPSTTRCPVSATAAATTRWPRPASARRSPWPRSPTSCRARSCSSARRPRSGAAARQHDDRGRPLRRASTPRCCSTPAIATTSRSHPLASEDVDVVFHGLQAHAASDPWKGQNALDAMILLFSSVGLWRQQLRPDARVHGIIQEGGTAANIIPDRTRAWFMLRSPDAGRVRGDAGPLPRRSARPRRSRPTRPSRSTFSGGSMTMKPERARSRRAGSRTPRPTGSRTRVRTRTPAAPTWATSAGSARRSTPSSRSRRRARPAIRSCSATRPRRRWPTRRRSSRRRSSPRRAYELFADPALVEAAWREFRGEG